jgi:predicted phosphoribosyltransferase
MYMNRPFASRTEAGKELATRLKSYADRPDVLVLALPRGGVPVAYEVAHAHAPRLTRIPSGKNRASAVKRNEVRLSL